MNWKELLILPFVVPHIIAYLFSSRKKTIIADLGRWQTIKKRYVDPNRPIGSILKLLIRRKDFRTQFYLRIGGISPILRFFLRPAACDIENDVFDDGLLMIHAIGIVINGHAKVGKNCTIYHGVTIGVGNNIKKAPQIGDNVFIGAGAKIIGNIKIGNNVKIGAGAIVVTDIPDGVTVISPKAKILL